MSKKKKHNQRLKEKPRNDKNASKKTLPQATEFLIKKPIYWAILILIFVIALVVRLQNSQNIAKDGRVQLQGADAYLFVRQAENIQNGGFAEKDPMLCFDDGYSTDRTLYPYMLALMSSLMTLEWAAALSSPIFALLSFAAVYLLLREVFPKNDFAVLGGTALAALTGIQLYSRSFFGMGDYHVLETFFSFFGIFALFKALKNNNMIWSVIAGIAFGLYVLSWFPSSIFIGILALSLVIIYLMSDKLPENLWKHLLIIFGITLLSHFLIPNRYVSIVCVGLIALIPVLEYLRKKISSKYNRLGIFIVVTLIALSVLYFINSYIIRKIFQYINEVFFAGNLEQNIKEMESMYNIYSRALKGKFLLYGWLQIAAFVWGLWGLTIGKETEKRVVWYMIISSSIILFICYLTGNYLLLVFMLLWCAYLKDWKQLLFFVAGISWSILALLHIRFEYYLVLFIGVGAGYMITKHRYIMWGTLIVGILFSISLWMNQVGSSSSFSDAYFKTALWLRENTADTGVADSGNYIDYKAPNYGILGNWETGYLYAYRSKRPQITSPSHCNYKEPSEFFMMSDENEAYKYAKERNIKYIIVDSPTLFRYFYHTAQAEKPTLQTRRVNIQNETATLIESSYYKTIYARMYTFDGKEYAANNTFVVNSKEVKYFKDFEDAENYIKVNGGEYYSYDLKISPVPLQELKHFKLIHSEGEWLNGAKVFEVVD